MYSINLLIYFACFSQNNDQVELFDEILAGRYEFGSPYWDNISENAKVNLCNKFIHKLCKNRIGNHNLLPIF